MSTINNVPQPTSLDDCKGEIFVLYITGKKPLEKVMQIIEEKYRITATQAVYKNRLKKWGFHRNMSRAVALRALRVQEGSKDEQKTSPGYTNDRPVDMEKIERYRKRNQLPLRKPLGMENNTESTSISRSAARDWAHATPSPQAQPGRPLSPPQAVRIPEKLIFDISNYIKGSFEVKDWQLNGIEAIIRSSASQQSQEAEVHSLHSFLTALDTGNSNFAAGRSYDGGIYWRRAFREVKLLVQGSYHDIIPNIIQKINDLNEGGHTRFADLLKTHVARMGITCHRQGDIRMSIYRCLAELSLEQMRQVEDMMMQCFTDLFNLYLGDRCYNTFVMQMDLARRRLSVGEWVNIEDNLPTLSILDYKFGFTDRRSLDVIRLRVETLFQRKQYAQALTHAVTLVERAEKIENDEWQHHYFLIKGLYYAGMSSFTIPGHELETDSKLSRCFEMIQDFYRLQHNFSMFDAEMSEVIEVLEELAIRRLDEESLKIWKGHREKFQERFDSTDNTMELLEELLL